MEQIVHEGADTSAFQLCLKVLLFKSCFQLEQVFAVILPSLFVPANEPEKRKEGIWDEIAEQVKLRHIKNSVQARFKNECICIR